MNKILNQHISIKRFHNFIIDLCTKLAPHSDYSTTIRLM